MSSHIRVKGMMLHDRKKRNGSDEPLSERRRKSAEAKKKLLEDKHK